MAEPEQHCSVSVVDARLVPDVIVPLAEINTVTLSEEPTGASPA